MKFSIVTISYNQARFLERTILSVLKQDGCDYEYIVVDPGSTDGSREIIDRYRSHIAHVIFQEDSGPADGLNRGFSKAIGDYFGYLNSDDYYLPGGLAKARIAAEKYRNAAAVVGNGVVVDANDHIIKRATSTNFSLSSVAYGACFSLQQATFYKADAFRGVGGFNLLNRTSWDAELLVDIALAGGEIKHFSSDVGAFRLHSSSITGSGRLNSLYNSDVERMFVKILGRRRNVLDRLFFGPYRRTATRVADPMRTIRQVQDRLFFKPSGLPR